MSEKPTFEENLDHLEKIVTELEKGNVPLEEALSQFKQGVQLSQDLQTKLDGAEKTLAKMMTDDDKTVAFEAPAETQDDADGDKG